MLGIKKPKEHFVERIIKEAISTEYTSINKHEFRTSSLPYCPIHDLKEIIEDTPIPEGYKKEFFTRLGTQVHENLQNMCGLSKLGKYVFGSWECPNCHKKYEMTFRPSKCKDCGSKLLNYVEVAYNYKGLSGHQDMIACYPVNDKGEFIHLEKEERKAFRKELKHNYNSTKFKHRWCGFEYKTTGTDYLFTDKIKYLPYPKHFGQIEAYCVMAHLLYDINFDEYSIIYISRECPEKDGNYYFKPFVYEWTQEMYDYRLMTIKRACKSRKLVEEYIKTKNDDILKEIVKLRPCQCMTDWESYMKKHYFGNETCPFLEKCLSNSILDDIDFIIGNTPF